MAESEETNREIIISVEEPFPKNNVQFVISFPGRPRNVFIRWKNHHHHHRHEPSCIYIYTYGIKKIK